MRITDPDPFDPEWMVGELENAYPGLHPTHYQAIVLQAVDRYDTRAKALEWALISARLALLEQSRKDDAEDAIWQS